MKVIAGFVLSMERHLGTNAREVQPACPIGGKLDSSALQVELNVRALRCIQLDVEVSKGWVVFELVYEAMLHSYFLVSA